MTTHVKCMVHTHGNIFNSLVTIQSYCNTAVVLCYSIAHSFNFSDICDICQQSWLSGRAQNSQAVDQNSRLKQL